MAHGKSQPLCNLRFGYGELLFRPLKRLSNLSGFVGWQRKRMLLFIGLLTADIFLSVAILYVCFTVLYLQPPCLLRMRHGILGLCRLSCSIRSISLYWSLEMRGYLPYSLYP